MQGMERARRRRPPRGTYTEFLELDDCNTSDDSFSEGDECIDDDVDTSKDRSKQTARSKCRFALFAILLF